ncbi:MAG: L-seryl-tRNA(Sec) selenium transferase [candidate division Zixibacteria bacterium]|nr:L-seryl-tRNA(Sec) selenium transferase [candidate division Zixibacteria bacterium]
MGSIPTPSAKFMTKLSVLPSIEKLAERPEFVFFIESLSRPIVVETARNVVADFREKLRTGGSFEETELIAAIIHRLKEKERRFLVKVINGTGVILHTNLGRAPLSRRSLEKAAERLSGYVNLEFDLKTGKRGGRGAFVEELFCLISGAEAALVVNNNASVLYLALSVLARGKEVIISRGELIQIGGGFKIPEILEEAGAILKEVGTTNRTMLADYEKATGEKTALILKVHTSNFKQMGFVESVPAGELASLARSRGILLVEDLGSGAFVPTDRFGLPREPLVASAVEAGCDLVTFSGDKLLAGPQAGIAVGKKEVVERLKKSPLFRALRVDKLYFLLLGEALKYYLNHKETLELPAYRLLSTPVESLKARAGKIANDFQKQGVELVQTESQAGGGALPEEALSSWGIALPEIYPANVWEEKFRAAAPPVIGKIANERLVIDLRAVFPEEDEILVSVLKTLL